MSDYEKKYKEALEVAKRKLCFDKAGMVDSFTPNDIYEMFPELKESEDERIREVLIDYFKRYKDEECGIKTFYGIPADDILAWLEKQGTQPRYNIGDILCDLSCNEYDKDSQLKYEIIDIKNGTYICDNGSIPVSQQDEYKLVAKKAEQKPVKVNNDEDSVSNELREASFIFAARQMVHKASPEERKLELIYSFEEGAKWQAARKSSWSKDDDNNIGMIESRLIDLLSYTREDNSLTKHRKNSIKEEVVGYINWLTSLEDRSTWKPSDAQMIALNDVITNGHLSNANERILKGLQEQLKKLK